MIRDMASPSSTVKEQHVTNEGARKLTRSAGVVSAGVMVSRLLGLVREQVLAYLFPARLGLDAFYAAFRIPNLLRDMFGEGALSKAFISTLSDVESKEGDEASLRLANLVFNALGVVMSVLTILGIVYADTIVDVIFGGEGFDVALPEAVAFGLATKRDLTVLLTRIMFPFILLVTLAALAMGVLNARGKFFVPAMASSFFNLGSVVVGVAGAALAPRYGYHPTVGMAVGVLAGGALQLLWQMPSLSATGFRFRPDFSFRDPRLFEVARLFGPGALVASTVQVNVMVNSIFASRGEGWVSWLSQSFRVLHLPLGLIGVAVSVATLPALSRAVAAGKNDQFLETFSDAIRLVILFTVPATVGLLVLADPIVRLIFEQGEFGADDTLQVAAALRFYAVGLLSYASVKIVTDGFYAIKDVRAPMKVSLLGMLANLLLNWLFVVRLGLDHRGLALATSGTMTFSVIALWVMFRRRSPAGRLDGRRSLVTFLKTTVAAAVMGAAAFVTFRLVDASWGHERVLARLAQVSGAVLVALVVYFLACRALRVREMDQALSAWFSRR